MLGRTIALEGQIGAGKTTLGLRLAEILNLPFLAEIAAPETELLLERFYADKARWAFTTQTHFIIRRAATVQAMPEGAGGILDRSLYGDRIFAEMLHEDGYMSDPEFATYSDLFSLLSDAVEPPDLMVFLDVSVDEAMNRIRRRNRAGEANISREYLTHLDRKYRAWFEAYDISAKVRVAYDDFPINDPGATAGLIEELRGAIA